MAFELEVRVRAFPAFVGEVLLELVEADQPLLRESLDLRFEAVERAPRVAEGLPAPPRLQQRAGSLSLYSSGLERFGEPIDLAPEMLDLSVDRLEALQPELGVDQLVAHVFEAS